MTSGSNNFNYFPENLPIFPVFVPPPRISVTHFAAPGLPLDAPDTYTCMPSTEIYTGPNFLTQVHQPNIPHTQPNPTHECLGRTPNPTRAEGGSAVGTNYFKCRLLFCMHVKINTNMRHKSEHSINTRILIFLQSPVQGSSSHLASSSD